MTEEFARSLTWGAFLAMLTSETEHCSSDRLLWRMTKPNRTIVCRVREVLSRHFAVGLEIRVEHNGQVYLTELHRERVMFSRRVAELRELLEAEGWMVTELVSS
jgi:hypothetical protein